MKIPKLRFYRPQTVQLWKPDYPKALHEWRNIWLDNVGGNYNAVTWTTDEAEDPKFNTPNTNPLYRCIEAPPRCAFLLYGIHFDAFTIHVVLDDNTQMGSCNMDTYVHLGAGSMIGSSFLSAERQLFHCRLRFKKLGIEGKIGETYYDPGDGTVDEPTDIFNPLNNTEFKNYEPSHEIIFPNGIYVGKNLCFSVYWGGHQNMQRFAGGTTRFKWLIDFSLVKRKEFERLLGVH